MERAEYGPLAFLVGSWKSNGWTGENRAPDPNLDVENTRFRQEMTFEPIGDTNNHDQTIYGLSYKTVAWEEGDDDPFHEEVGYWLWDEANKQVLKSFIVPRGIAVQAGGTCESNACEFSVQAKLGSPTYGICSNQFLHEKFKTVQYDLKIERLDENSFKYDENTQIEIFGKEGIFDHTERNTMYRL